VDYGGPPPIYAAAHFRKKRKRKVALSMADMHLTYYGS